MNRDASAPPLALAGLLGLGHLAVDAATAATIAALALRPELDYGLAMGYIAGFNVVAFVSQPPLGWLVDRWRAYRGSAVLGCLLATAGAILLPHAAVPALLLSALGNALFHVGAGGTVLALWPRSASAQGLFVGPGDLAVLVGLLVGRGVWPTCEGWFALASLATIVPVLAMPATIRSGPPAAARSRTCAWPLALLIMAVMCRPATVGWLAGPVSWDHLAVLAQLYVIAAVAKCLGGIVADRWGWRPTVVLAACLTAVLVPYGQSSTTALLLAAALAQVPTGVTLAAIGERLPAWPAAAFGLTTLFVFIGGPPAVPRLPSVAWAVLAQLVGALALAVALAPRAAGNQSAGS